MKNPAGARIPPFSFRWPLYILLGVLYLGFLLWTLSTVPFHPDESTYIYMSSDLDRILLQGPFSVCWTAENKPDRLQILRVSDCPLNRYTIGVARLVAGLPALVSSWAWEASWDQNLKQGEVPSAGLLLAARIPQALLLFLAVLLMARIGWQLGGEVGAVSAAVLLAVNSQVLLHARRAMAEAGLLFGMVLVIAVVLEQKDSAGKIFRAVIFPLMAGASLALAASAKYSALLVAPPALAGMFLLEEGALPREKIFRGMARFDVMALSFLLVFLALNPVYWCHPLPTLSAAISQRQNLVATQVAALRSAAPGLVLDSLPLRLLAVPYQLFFAAPAFWDIPNYAQITAASERAYLSNPLNSLTSGGALSLLWCILSLYGLALAIRRGARRGGDGRMRIAVIWFVSVLGGILIGVPILWQRYYLPLVPVFVVFASIAVSTIVKGLILRLRLSQSFPLE